MSRHSDTEGVAGDRPTDSPSKGLADDGGRSDTPDLAGSAARNTDAEDSILHQVAFGSEEELASLLPPPEDLPLVAFEECAPRLVAQDFMSVLMNTDPRAAFDVVHFGCLFAMEEMDEGLREWSSRGGGPDWDLPPVSIQRSPFRTATASHGRTAAASSDACLEVDTIHAHIYRRGPLERDERLIEGILFHKGRSAMMHDVLGPDLLLALRRSRRHSESPPRSSGGVGQRKRERSAAEMEE